jgi:large subunit ribosomal protein L10
MPLSRTQKEELVASYTEGLATAPHAFLVDYKGVSVPEATDLRNRIRESGGQYIVVKNRLLLRAIEGAALEELKEHLQGPVAVAYGDGDPVSLAKALSEFAKDVPALEFKAGLVDGKAVAAEEIKEIATLPSREELVAKLVFMLQSPIARFVRGLGAIPQQFVSVLHQVGQEKAKQEG